MKIKIIDIANKCGLSPSAVSQILNGKPVRVSEEKRQLVFETAAQMGYKKPTRKKYTPATHAPVFGVILPDVCDNYYSAMLHSMLVVSRDLGCHLQIYDSSQSPELDEVNLRNAANGKVDGIIYAPHFDLIDGETESRHVREMMLPFVKQYGAKLLVLDRFYANLKCSFSSCNDYLAGYMATTHLLDKGYQKIGFLSGLKNRIPQLDRLAGARTAFAENYLHFEEDFVQYHAASSPQYKEYSYFYGAFLKVTAEFIQEGKEQAKKLFEEGARAFVTHNALVTEGCLQFCASLTKQQQREISIVDFVYDKENTRSSTDDTEVALTRIYRPLNQIAGAAIKVLMDLYAGKETSPQIKIFLPEFVSM